jgi:hypothetical protein
MSRLGAAAKSVAARHWRATSESRRWQLGTATRSFQSVSPSSWSVRRKMVPDCSVVRTTIMSAGTRWLVRSAIRSPTRIWEEGMFSRRPPEQRRSYISPFNFRSLSHRFTSSCASLTIVMTRTNVSGAMYVKRNPTLSGGKNCETATTRK